MKSLQAPLSLSRGPTDVAVGKANGLNTQQASMWMCARLWRRCVAREPPLSQKFSRKEIIALESITSSTSHRINSPARAVASPSSESRARVFFLSVARSLEITPFPCTHHTSRQRRLSLLPFLRRFGNPPTRAHTGCRCSHQCKYTHVRSAPHTHTHAHTHVHRGRGEKNIHHAEKQSVREEAAPASKTGEKIGLATGSAGSTQRGHHEAEGPPE